MIALFEDENYIIVNKESGLITHPSNECRHLKDSLLFQVRDLVGQYVYPVNRLDRGVSGVIMFAKNSESVKDMQDIWDKSEKSYLALCNGIIEEPGTFDFELTNHKKNIKQAAITIYSPIQVYADSTYLKVNITTGRHHQIRRHFSRRMHALLGDRKYGKKKWNDKYLEDFSLKRIFLHSHILNFTHPYTKENITVTQDLPPDLKLCIDKMNHEKN